MSALYHYTCYHGNAAIAEDGGIIKPGPDGMVWLTDLRVPIRDALGLTSVYITCDRIAFRWAIDPIPETVEWWPRWLRHATPAWRKWGRLIEMAPGVRPAHWYVSTIPVEGVQHERRESPTGSR